MTNGDMRNEWPEPIHQSLLVSSCTDYDDDSNQSNSVQLLSFIFIYCFI